MDSLATQLSQLEHAQLVRRLLDDDPAYFFKHALTQETAYESLLVKKRRELHRRVALAYEALYPEQLDALAALLAEHYDQAGEGEKTVEYSIRAGDNAARVYANAEAISHYSRALAVAKGSTTTDEQLSHIMTGRGRAFELTGQYDRALENYKEMESLALARGSRWLQVQTLIRQTNLHSTSTSVYDPALAQELANRALAIAQELGDRVARCRVLWNLLTLNHYRGQPALAIQYGEQALALAREMDLREEMAYILNDLGGAYSTDGQVERATLLLEQARPLWQELGNQPMLAENLMLLGSNAMIKGDYDLALSTLDIGLEISRAIGNIGGMVGNAGTQAQVCLEHGDFGRALRLTQENVRMAQAAAGFMAALPASSLAFVYATLGALPIAREMASFARANLNSTILPYFMGLTRTVLARTYCLCGDPVSAEQVLDAGAAESTVSATLSPSLFVGAIAEGELALAEGELALAKGEYARTVSRMRTFVQESRRFGLRHLLSEALYIQAEGIRGQGDNAAALEILEQAHVEAEGCQVRITLWQILGSMSEIERERGNESRAQELKTQSQSVLSYIVEHIPPEFRGSFLDLRQVNRVMERSRE